MATGLLNTQSIMGLFDSVEDLVKLLSIDEQGIVETFVCSKMQQEDNSAASGASNYLVGMLTRLVLIMGSWEISPLLLVLVLALGSED